MTGTDKLSAFRRRLAQPEDAAALAVFRMGFGLILCYDMFNYAWFYRIEDLYLRSDFKFKYLGFEWVPMLPGDGLVWLLTALSVLALMIAAGLFYRLSTVLFAIGFSWFYLIERATYLNHFYMVILFAVLLCVVPAGRLWSLDVRWRGMASRSYAPRWGRWLLLAQLEIILIYAGLVKINPDWLNLAPLEEWLAQESDLFLVGNLFTQRWAVAVAAYGVIALHLIGAPLLLFKRTRVAVLCVYTAFHTLNHFVFQIGIFPWFTLFASLLCLEPDWPRRLWHRIRRGAGPYLAAPDLPAQPLQPPGAALMVFICVWLFVQAALPLRHLLYDGDVAWNDDGHLFSWRMKLRERQGSLSYMVRDKDTGQQWILNPRDFLTPYQVRKMACRPDMILQFAHHLADIWIHEKGVAEPGVFALSICSLNYRPYQKQIDPYVDLTTISHWDSMDKWVLPLEKELPNRIIPWSRIGGIGAPVDD